MPVALFNEGQLGSADAPHRSKSRLSRAERRVRTGWVFLSVAIVLGLVLALAPTPYVIERPGPVFDVLGTADHEGTPRPLIEIPDATTYPTDGELNLLTVSLYGNRETRPSWFDVLLAWASPEQAVKPVDLFFPPNVSTADREAANEQAMVSSQQDAVVAALVNLGYEVPRTLVVKSLPDGSPSAGIIEADDEIVAINGVPVHDLSALRAAAQANGTSSPASVTVKRNGEDKDVSVTPADLDGTAVLGINVATVYGTLPVDVQIQLDNVGGPSAGMMFALGIVDKLTPGPLTEGKDWAGTGTIDASGAVGPIGGIRQKMFGAQKAGAKWFLAPSTNCDEVVGNIPSGVTVFSVSTLDEAITAIETVANDGDTASLPSCSLSASAP